MIRKRKPMTDDRLILRMIRRYLLPMKRTFFPDTVMYSKELRKRLAKGVTYVTTSGSRKPVDGFCHAVVKGDTLWIDLLAVNARKRKKGRGALLLARAEQYGRAKGCQMVRLFVDEHNEAAQRFYHKLGFELQAYEQRVHCYILSKKISDGHLSKTTVRLYAYRFKKGPSQYGRIHRG